MSQGVEEPLRAFYRGVSDAIELGGGERAVAERVADGLRELLRHRPFLPPEVQRPATDRYAMYPLMVAPDGAFSVAAAVWGVGQESPVHDHGTWGVIGIHQGVEREARFAHAQRREDGPALACVEESELVAGQVKVCCTSDHDIHAVSCGSSIPCVGIHVYGADIGTLVRHAYDVETGHTRDFVSHWTEPDQGSTG